ncbi:CRISPR-associated protein, CT1133 family [Oxalobacteraceae bacterium IMCC9480]|nr:CRISPR-associated protein, CT1133 family [Oxalobacteraceae bacterium IMCC9480]
MAQSFLVPQGLKKAYGVASNLLWDTVEYTMGIDTRGNPARVAGQYAAFLARLHALPESAQQDPGLIAILGFLARIDIAHLATFPMWAGILEANPLITFRLQGDLDLICQRPAIVAAITSMSADEDATTARGICLVTGNLAPIGRLHTAIKNVWGAQSSGANIVSFNKDAYCSFGNNGKQGANSPVSEYAVFAYTTALNALLEKNSGQRVQVGDASTVFWAEADHALESLVADAFGEAPKDDPARGTSAVQRVFEWAQSGKATTLDGDTRFFVLGLAPNAARISIRFWHVLPIRELATRMTQHYLDLEIVRGKFDAEYPSLFRLLSACATQGKAENIPPNLGGEVMRSVLTGSPYPATLISAAIRRCRAEQDVTYHRAAVIKACLNRSIRAGNLSTLPPQKEFTAMLDPDNQSTAYRLGRLFAVLEKIQEEASPGLNATIRDRYYGAASSTPVTVFTTLLRLHHHHLGKLGIGRRVNMEKLIGEIMLHIDQFPAQLPLAEQGRFAIGYYHQRQAFFSKPHSPEEGASA